MERDVTVPKLQSCSALEQGQGDTEAARCVSIKCHQTSAPICEVSVSCSSWGTGTPPLCCPDAMGRKICQSSEMSHSCRQEHLRVLQLNHPDPESVPCAVTVGLQSAQAFEMNQKCMPFWTTVSSCLQTCKDEQCRSNSHLPVEALFVVESHYWGFFLFLIYYYLRRLSWGLLQSYGQAVQLFNCLQLLSCSFCGSVYLF